MARLGLIFMLFRGLHGPKGTGVASKELSRMLNVELCGLGLNVVRTDSSAHCVFDSCTEVVATSAVPLARSTPQRRAFSQGALEGHGLQRVLQSRSHLHPLMTIPEQAS